MTISTAPAILGLDLSLTASGIALPDGTTLTIASKQRHAARLADIRNEISLYLSHVDLVVIEHYAFNSRHNAHQLGELGGVIRLALWDFQIPYVDVAPSARAKYATGRGNAAKSAVVSEISARTGRTFADDNQADAYILHLMGLDAYGHPTISLPNTHRQALTNILWPNLTRTAGTQ